jgi:hypothetical protein
MFARENGQSSDLIFIETGHDVAISQASRHWMSSNTMCFQEGADFRRVHVVFGCIDTSMLASVQIEKRNESAAHMEHRGIGSVCRTAAQ